MASWKLMKIAVSYALVHKVQTDTFTVFNPLGSARWMNSLHCKFAIFIDDNICSLVDCSTKHYRHNVSTLSTLYMVHTVHVGNRCQIGIWAVSHPELQSLHTGAAAVTPSHSSLRVSRWWGHGQRLSIVQWSAVPCAFALSKENKSKPNKPRRRRRKKNTIQQGFILPH